MPSERFQFCAAVYGVLRSDDRVLLMRRAGSGYNDGKLGLPSGHLDGNEDAVAGLLRELNEEIGITAKRDSCKLALLLHRAPESPADNEYLDLIFTVDAWSGEPSIGEPDKCTELVWADLHQLPDDTVDYVGAALAAVNAGESLLLYGWPR